MSYDTPPIQCTHPNTQQQEQNGRTVTVCTDCDTVLS